ncbi:splicing factor 3B subunit 4-like [Poecile atricapillus]|uniref:splicing factor 3B subunit 4-like n=1 Tax=Poecile atricapillus TaxID=48891 RepID=UPI002738D854|nr:splicing factor 3B subunit 4-like [Poecile atricapillus]
MPLQSSTAQYRFSPPAPPFIAVGPTWLRTAPGRALRAPFPPRAAAFPPSLPAGPRALPARARPRPREPKGGRARSGSRRSHPGPAALRPPEELSLPAGSRAGPAGRGTAAKIGPWRRRGPESRAPTKGPVRRGGRERFVLPLLRTM